MSKYRVSDEDGLWYVEERATGKWWTVADDLDAEHVVGGTGRVVKPGSATHTSILRAVREHIATTSS